tara:strand:+ start:247 stop:810 length:564 start_codon:yes stop_codon:yes gene_type:complete
MNEFDTRGRLIAQSYWTELEKIAVSHRLLLRGANVAGQRVDDYVKATGVGAFQRLTGLGQRGRAYKALKARELKFRKGGIEKLKSRKAVLNEHIARGGPNQARAVRELAELNKVKSKTPSPWSDKPRVAAKTTGGGTDPVSTEAGPTTLRRVAVGTGVGLGVAGTAVGGKKVYDWDKKRKQGYGPGY